MRARETEGRNLKDRAKKLNVDPVSQTNNNSGQFFFKEWNRQNRFPKRGNEQYNEHAQFWIG